MAKFFMKIKKTNYLWFLLIFVIIFLFVLSTLGFYLSSNKSNDKDNIYTSNVATSDANSIDISKILLNMKQTKTIVDIDYLNGYYINFFSHDLFELNIFSIINEALKIFKEKSNDKQFENFITSDYSKKIEYTILDNLKTLNLKLLLVNKKNKNIYYKSNLQFFLE